jgi:tRNA(fMet)-specific endonuclease VapC
MVLLDTDILIQFLRNDEDAKEKISRLLESYQLLSTSSINVAELYFGAYLSENKEENINAVNKLLSKLVIYPFDIIDGKIYGEIRASLKRKGELINELDIFIASIAIEKDITLITRNIKHYEKVHKVQVETW